MCKHPYCNMLDSHSKDKSVVYDCMIIFYFKKKILIEIDLKTKTSYTSEQSTFRANNASLTQEEFLLFVTQIKTRWRYYLSQ